MRESVEKIELLGWILYIAQKMTQLDFFLGIFFRDQLNLIVNLTNADLNRMIFPATIRWDMIIFGGFLF